MVSAIGRSVVGLFRLYAQLIDVRPVAQVDGSTTFVFVHDEGSILHRTNDGQTDRSCKAGDVFSPQPSGLIESRDHGTAGAYERGVINGATVAFRPAGTLCVFEYVANVPE